MHPVRKPIPTQHDSQRRHPDSRTAFGDTNEQELSAAIMPRSLPSPNKLRVERCKRENAEFPGKIPPFPVPLSDSPTIYEIRRGSDRIRWRGQPLSWLELDLRQQLHWFGVTNPQPLCQWCWQQSSCSRQFSYPANQHEILLGRIPLTSQTGQLLLNQVRCWIETAQSYEKNQLGLNQMFFNSLRFTWTACLLADAVVILRAHALLQQQAPQPSLLRDLLPHQLPLGLH